MGKNYRDILLGVLIILNIVILYLIIETNKNPYIHELGGTKDRYIQSYFKCFIEDNDINSLAPPYNFYPSDDAIKVEDIIPNKILRLRITRKKKYNSEDVEMGWNNLFTYEGASIELHASSEQSSPVFHSRFYGYDLDIEKKKARKEGRKLEYMPERAYSGSFFHWQTHQPRPDRFDTGELRKERKIQKNDRISSGFRHVTLDSVEYRASIDLKPVTTFWMDPDTPYKLNKKEDLFDKKNFRDARYVKKVFLALDYGTNVLHFGMQEYTAYAYRPGFDKVPGYKITFRGNCEKIPKRNIFP